MSALPPAAQVLAARLYARRTTRLRRALGGAAVTAFDRLDDYHDAEEFAELMSGLSRSAQRMMATELHGYMSAVTGEFVGLDLDEVTDKATRDGGLLSNWHIPFFSLWSALSAGLAFAQAIADARADVARTAVTDLALTQRETMSVLSRDIGVVTGYLRVPVDSACQFCNLISSRRYHVGELMPVHTNCGCSVAPLIEGLELDEQTTDELIAQLALAA